MRRKDARLLLRSCVSVPSFCLTCASYSSSFAPQDPTALPLSHPPAGSASATLQTLERRTQTLQLALEVLSEWLASGVPNSASLAGGDAEEDEADEMLAEEDEEEWGGVSMAVEDVAMGSDGEDEDEDDGIIRKALPEEDDGMLDDLAATAGADLDSDDEAAAKTAIKLLGGSLPLQLLSLSQPTSLAFLPPAAFTEAVTSASGNSTSSSLLSTSTSQAVLLPSALSPLSEALTTLSVRALEALNNLYVTLSKAGAKRDVKNEVQVVFEKVLGGMHAALGASVAEGKLKAETPVKAGKGKKAAAEKPAGAEEEQDENEERRLEVVMAGSGVVWGCVRLGLESEGEQLVCLSPFALCFPLVLTPTSSRRPSVPIPLPSSSPPSTRLRSPPLPLPLVRPSVSGRSALSVGSEGGRTSVQRRTRCVSVGTP